MIHLPKNKTMQIIKGIIESDGCITKRENYEIALDMTSRNVVESVRFMLMRFGILTSGYIRDRRGSVSSYKNITTQKISYCLRLPKIKDVANLFNLAEGSFTSYFTYGKQCFSRIDKLSITKYSGIVVDFEVEPNHNYVTHAGVAHNGGGKRKGAFAIYLEPWHDDVFDFLDLKKNHGKEEMRARDLFFALWISDLFMKRVQDNGVWSLFCPNEAPGLSDCYGDEFEALYTRYEREGKARRIVKPGQVFSRIHVEDIATVLEASIAKPNAGAIYNVCDDLPAPDHPFHGFCIHVADEARDEESAEIAGPAAHDIESGAAPVESRPWYEAEEEIAPTVELTEVFDASDEIDAVVEARDLEEELAAPAEPAQTNLHESWLDLVSDELPGTVDAEAPAAAQVAETVEIADSADIATFLG